MKNNLLSAVFATVLLFAVSQNCSAQQDEWTQGHTKGIYSIGFGGTDGIFVGGGGYYGYYGAAIVPAGISINAAGEYKVWKFIGVGWQTGINIYPYYGVVGLEIPFIAKANVHILDAANVAKDASEV